jgi:hypothetical protein
MPPTPRPVHKHGSTDPPRLCKIHKIDRPVLFVLNRVCALLDDTDENESLAIPFNPWAHGVKYRHLSLEKENHSRRTLDLNQSSSWASMEKGK